VEFLGQLGAAFAHDETTVLRAVGQEIDKALETAEAGLERILVLNSKRVSYKFIMIFG
jgi:hypothetical protein